MASSTFTSAKAFPSPASTACCPLTTTPIKTNCKSDQFFDPPYAPETYTSYQGCHVVFSKSHSVNDQAEYEAHSHDGPCYAHPRVQRDEHKSTPGSWSIPKTIGGIAHGYNTLSMRASMNNESQKKDPFNTWTESLGYGGAVRVACFKGLHQHVPNAVPVFAKSIPGAFIEVSRKLVACAADRLASPHHGLTHNFPIR